MDTRPESKKRKRLVTTCSECHRRKQKCDRQKPCNICTSRNVPERCSYGDEPGSKGDDSAKTNQSSSVSIQHEEDYQDSGFQGLGFAERIGYSPMVGSNVFVDMRQVLEEGTERTPEDSDPISQSAQKKRANDRFWSLVEELPSQAIIDELVGFYFSEVNWYYPILERYYFQKLKNSWAEATRTGNGEMKQITLSELPRDLVYFPALLFQVLAIGLQFAPPEALAPKILKVESVTASDLLSRTFSDKGMAIMNILGRYHTTLAAVQHDFLRALWLKDCGRGSESWHSLGNAVRQAQELNLHLQNRISQRTASLEDTIADLWFDEYKRRVWVHLFVWDSHMALVLGRPRIINLNDCDVRAPIDCSIPDNPLTSVPTAHSLAGDETPSNFTTTLFQNSMAYLIHEMRTSGANQRFPKDYQVIQDLHQRVDHLLDTVPVILRPKNPDTSLDAQFPNLRRQREQILCSGNSFLSALHRPHIHIYPESRRAAILAALTIIEAQQRFFDLTPPHQCKFFGLAFYTIDSASFLSTVCLVYVPPDPNFRNRIEVALRQALARLRILEEVNAVAGAGLKILSHCHEKMQTAFAIDANLMTFSSPEDLATGSGDSASSKFFMNEDYPRPLNLNSFQRDMYLPANSFTSELQMDNEFDAEFWMEKMAQIPYVPPEDFNFDPTWALPMT